MRKEIKMSRPDFFVAGFYKCGTTSLYYILQQHRNILTSKEKENLFFADKELYKKGIMWYEKVYYDFEKKRSEEKIIEVNPGLSNVSGTAKRLSQFYEPNTPIVFIIRNPVEFLYSHFKFRVRRGEYPLREMSFCKRNSYAFAFDRYIESNKEELKHYKHFFSSQLKEYQQYFNHIKIIFLEDMHQDAEKVYREILKFWGMEYEEADVNIRANATDFIPRYLLLKKIHLSVRKYNQRLMIEEKKATMQCLFKITRSIEDNLFTFIEKTGIEDKSKIHEKTRMRLEKFFYSEKRFIENISGRDLQNIWW